MLRLALELTGSKEQLRREALPPTPLQAKLRWGGRDYVAACDLLRLIHTTALRHVGELDEPTSRELLRTFKLLLASND